MADSLRMVRDRAVELERQLDGLGAQGRGLGEKFRSLDLPPQLVHDLRQVNYLRNQVMHDGVELSTAEVQRFEQAAQRAWVALSELPTGHAQGKPRIQTMHAWRVRRRSTTIAQKAAVVMLLFIVAGYAFYGFPVGLVVMLGLFMLYGLLFPDRRRRRRRRR